MSNQILVTRSSSIIRVQRCLVAWSLKNVREPNNIIEVTKSSGKSNITIPQGYYTFSDLQKFLKSNDITIEKLADNQVSLISANVLDLKGFGTLLGFDENKSISANTLTVSTVSASLTNKLKNIGVSSSSLVDSSRVFLHSQQYFCNNSSHLFDLSIDTSQSLNGDFTEYNLNAIQIPCKNFYGQEFYIHVESGGHKDDYEIYLTLSID